VNLPRWSLKNPVTAGMMLLCVLVVGAISAPRLPLAFLPEVSFPGIEIAIPYPNALPAQVEEEITRPAEEALATLSRVRRIRSWSSASSANISVEFDWGEDIAPLRVEARNAASRPSATCRATTSCSTATSPTRCAGSRAWPRSSCTGWSRRRCGSTSAWRRCRGTGSTPTGCCDASTPRAAA
jgi:hypothetical protein